MATRISPEKKVNLPPKGNRNADPITNAPGSHPIETGIGAAAAGAAAGMAVGAVTGPVGAAIGAAVGAVAGGYAGKGVGEMIDPTTEDTWLRDNFQSRPYVRKGESFDTYHPAYRYGGEAEYKYPNEEFDAVEDRLASEWNAAASPAMPWTQARGAVKDAYDRTVQLRRARECPESCDNQQED
jgi:hypothetical protein